MELGQDNAPQLLQPPVQQKKTKHKLGLQKF